MVSKSYRKTELTVSFESYKPTISQDTVDKIVDMEYYVGMGTIPKAETKRDKALIKDYLLHTSKGEWTYSIAQLGIKYARMESGEIYPLTATRIHQILDKHGVKKKRSPVKKKKHKDT